MFRIEEVRKNNRARILISSFAAHIATIALVLIMVLGPSSASARRLPTPENFRVTATTAYTATVAWDPPRGNSGEFNYYLSGAYGVEPAVLPRTATSHTFMRLHSGNQYWFFIYARDAGGNTSGTANTTTRTLLDTTPPSTGPMITVTEIGSNYITLSWTPAQDDCPFLSYQVSVNGNAYTEPSPILSSDPVSVTTLPPNPNDHTPPTTPAWVSAYSFGDGSTEMQIQWAQSTDDFDAQSNIRYDVYINGTFEDVRFGSGGPITDYGVFGQNTIEVIASDTAGNASPPATTTLFIP